MASPRPTSSSPGRAVVARACCRVDLAGGTLDVWPLGLLHAGARTVNVAIDVEVSVEVEPSTQGCRIAGGGLAREETSWEAHAGHPDVALFALLAQELRLPAAAIAFASASPRGGGLGASSALGVALVAAAEAFVGAPASTVDRRAALVRDVEARLMGLPTGNQDQLAALLGGVLDIRHRPGGAEVEPLPVDLERLGESLVVAYSGSSHFSAANNWEVVRRRLDGAAESIALFEGIAEAAGEVAAALAPEDLPAVGRWMAIEWVHRRRLAPQVSTPVLETLLERATAAGAWGGKACGAGGGGCVAVLCPPPARRAVEAELAAAGAQLLAARPSPLGVRVEPVRA